MREPDQVFEQMAANREHAREELKAANLNLKNVRGEVERMMSSTAGTEHPKDLLDLYERAVRRRTAAAMATMR